MLKQLTCIFHFHDIDRRAFQITAKALDIDMLRNLMYSSFILEQRHTRLELLSQRAGWIELDPVMNP